MKNKGFTLIELLGVIIVVALISILAMPKIIEEFNRAKGDLSKTEEQIIFNAVDQYISKRPNSYIKTDGATYCISLQTLIDAGYLENPILDISTGESISNARKIKITVESANYNYKMLKEGEGC